MTQTQNFTDYAHDILMRQVRVGDLVAYGHSGRYAATRLGRVYQVDGKSTIRVWIVEREQVYNKARTRYEYTGKWIKSHHSKPLGFVKVDDTNTGIPTLEDLR